MQEEDARIQGEGAEVLVNDIWVSVGVSIM